MENPTAKPAADVAAFQAAYKTWRDAEDEYFQRLLAISRGEARADAEFDKFCDELGAKHRRFTELSKPFVTWR